MIKLREPFSQKVHLHIRQDMLQRLWDKYVPVSSQQYGQIELVYLKDAFGDMGKQPEQIKLLLHLLLKNKKLQLNLTQYPVPVKIFQKQLQNNLQRMERYYTVQLKCSNPTLYRTVKQYFTLLEQAQENRSRYQEWQKNYQEIEKQKDEYRLISLFSEKLRDYFAQYSVNTLRTMEREFVSSLSETEYQTLAEELIWQEKSEILTYFNRCDEVQCENIYEILEKATDMRQVLSLIPAQPVKENLIATAQRLEQREFCLFYHQAMKLENIAPQLVIWKENKTEMLSEIDRLAPETLQQMWNQMEAIAPLPEQEPLWIEEKGSRQDIQNSETLRTMEKELLHSLLETEYRTLAERLIWQEKPELITYFKSCEKEQCKEIVKKLEKDTYIRQVLSSLKKQSAKKKLVSAAYKLEQKEFSLFYWQVVELKAVNPQMVIWKNSREQMLRLLDELDSESVKRVWTQMESVGPVKGSKHVFTEKLLHLQKQVQQNESRSFQEQIAVILEENALENITDIIDIEQLVQDVSTSEYTEKPADVAKKPEFGFGEREYPVLWDRAYQVIRNLEREQEIRRERIEQQQVQAVETYQDVYHQILGTENILMQQEDVVQSAERIFREQYQEQLTGEEIQNIYEWSQALLEVHSAEQGVGSFSPNQMEQQELIYVVKEINRYIEEQHEFGERLTLRWQEDTSKDERIKKLLIYIRQLDEMQREQFIHYLADMVWLSVQLPSQRNLQRKASTVLQLDRMESSGMPMQSNKQESVNMLLRVEDRELAGKLLEVEDREFAKKLLQIEDRELIEKLLQIEDKELTKSLLQIEDKEFVEKLLEVEDRELIEKLLQIEDKEFTKSLLQIEDRELVRKLLQNNDGQLPDVSYRNLWEWGEVLLFYPEHQQEWEDADILAIPQQEMFSSDEAKQEDIQTQVIRRQIEIAKDRNRLQSLIRQINHQADLQLVYTDVWLRTPQVQTLLHSIGQLDERQYGVLVRELVQMIQLQKLSHEKLEAADTAVPAGEDNNRYNAKETNEVIVHNKTGFAKQPIQGNVYETDGKRLRTEDKEFIEKLLEVEDREFAESLLQINDRELVEKLLRVEDREFAKELLRIEDREFVESLLRIEDREFVESLLRIEDREFVKKLLEVEDREFAESLLQIEDREFVKELLQIKDREFAESLLRIEDREFVKKLLRIENREFAEKLLQNSDSQLPDVSYRNLWEWGEVLLFYPEYQQEREVADLLAISQQEAFSSDEAKQDDAQTQAVRQQGEIKTAIEEDRNRLQSLIRQINHQADLQLIYTDVQLRMPQAQTLLHSIEQLNEKQYGVLVEELVQIIKLQKLSYEEQGAAQQPVQGSAYESFMKKLRIEDKEFIENLLQVEDREFVERLMQMENKDFIEKLLQNNDRLLPDVSYRSLWEWGEALLQHSSSDEAKQEDEQTQLVHQQTETEKAKNHLQSLIRQINHRAGVRLVYTDAQLRVPQIQDLLQYIRQLDVRQYGAFVKELAQVTMIQKLSYDEPVITFPETSTALLEQRMIPYPILERYVQKYEEQRQLELYRDIRKVEQKIFPRNLGKENWKYVTDNNDAGNDTHGTPEYQLMPYEAGIDEYNLAAYETSGSEYGLALYEETKKEYAQITAYEKELRENRYQLQELEYSVQKASASEEDQQRNELRMQRENAQIKSVQEQLDKKLKEVEHQLKKVEDSTKVKEDVKTFAEQVKQQLYEELHVEKLRRGLI